MDAELRHLMGQRGTINTANTTAVTGVEVSCIQIVEDTVFTSVTEENATGAIATAWPAGSFIFGRITGYQLASGKVRAYLR
jgi:hypothetical protein